MEFTEYEIAKNKYYNNMSIKKYPLVSWDFYLSNFDKLKILLSDVYDLTKIADENKWNSNWNYKQKLDTETVIIVTDTKLNIVFASQNIINMNGYRPDEVIGSSPKMFQGELTDALVLKEISNDVKAHRPFNKVILNYCKDGSLYKCHIEGFPVFDRNDKLINFIAFEKKAA